MNTIVRGRFADMLPAEQFRAWRIPTNSGPECPHAIPLDVAAQTPDEALSAALCKFVNHKDHLAILQTHAGKNKHTLRLYAIKQESQPIYRKSPDTGLTEPTRRLYPALIVEMPVHHFDPVEQWKWEPGADVVGVDRSLVESKQ